MYVIDLIEEDRSDLSSRADALGTFQVDPLASHRATNPTKKKNKKVSSARDWLGYGPYTVSISKAPFCTCNDFVKSRTVKICKHIIWVYVAILGVDTSSNTLQQAALTVQEVHNIFDNAPLPPPLSPSPPT